MPKVSKIDLSKYVKLSQHLKLVEGENRVRIVTEPYHYYVVGKRTANGYIQHVLQEGVEVPKFLKDGKPKQMYGFVVFSHDTGHFHMIETGVVLGHQLTELIKQKFPEEYKGYDIIITRKGKEFNDTKYTCRYAEKSIDTPAGVNRNSPEFKFILSYFEGI